MNTSFQLYRLGRVAVRSTAVAMSVGVLVAASGGVQALADPAPNDAGIAPDVPATAPASTATSPDGWALTLSAVGESLIPVDTGDPAVPPSDYTAAATFQASLRGPKGAKTPTPSGNIDVGYQVQCGGLMAMMKPAVTEVPVIEQEFKGTDPSVTVRGFRVHVGCPGHALVRSYAILTRTSGPQNTVVAYYGLPNPA